MNTIEVCTGEEVVGGQDSCSGRLKYREWKHPIQPSYSPTESTSYLFLLTHSSSDDVPTLSSSIMPIPDQHVSITPTVLSPHETPAPASAPPPQPPPPPLLPKPRGRTTTGPADKYGFPCMNVVAKPSTYHETSIIPEWQLAMSEELAALDRTCTWDLVLLPSHAMPITSKWVFKRPGLMVLLSDIKLGLLL